MSQKTGKSAPSAADLQDFDDELPAANDAGNLSYEELFSISRPTFTLKDGSVIEFRTPADFVDEEVGRFTRLRKLLDGNLKRMEAHPDDAAAIASFKKNSQMFLKMILPDIPDELLRALTLGQRDQLMRFWLRETGQTGDGSALKNGSDGQAS
jgi:hypothetical protein